MSNTDPTEATNMARWYRLGCWHQDWHDDWEGGFLRWNRDAGAVDQVTTYTTRGGMTPVEPGSDRDLAAYCQWDGEARAVFLAWQTEANLGLCRRLLRRETVERAPKHGDRVRFVRDVKGKANRAAKGDVGDVFWTGAGFGANYPNGYNRPQPRVGVSLLPDGRRVFVGTDTVEQDVMEPTDGDVREYAATLARERLSLAGTQGLDNMARRAFALMVRS